MKKEKTSKSSYRKYDASFKADAVNQMKNGRSPKDVSELLGVSQSLLYKWRNEQNRSKSEQNQSAEIKRLRKQLKSIEEENEILKKALRIFSQSG